MNSIRLLAAVLPLVAATAAHAGSTGAGPAGSAGPAIGSIVVPGSNTLLNTATPLDYALFRFLSMRQRLARTR